MKTQSGYVTPAEAGYFTTQQWDSAFRGAFELLRSDARFRNRGNILNKSKSSKTNNGSRQMTQEATHGKVR